VSADREVARAPIIATPPTIILIVSPSETTLPDYYMASAFRRRFYPPVICV